MGSGLLGRKASWGSGRAPQGWCQELPCLVLTQPTGLGCLGAAPDPKGPEAGQTPQQTTPVPANRTEDMEGDWGPSGKARAPLTPAQSPLHSSAG